MYAFRDVLFVSTGHQLRGCKLQRVPGSSAQTRRKSEPAQQAPLPSAHEKRERERAARSKAAPQAVSGALSGLTEQALLDREHRPLDINRTDSSPADTLRQHRQPRKSSHKEP